MNAPITNIARLEALEEEDGPAQPKLSIEQALESSSPKTAAKPNAANTTAQLPAKAKPQQQQQQQQRGLLAADSADHHRHRHHHHHDKRWRQERIRRYRRCAKHFAAPVMHTTHRCLICTRFWHKLSSPVHAL
jgi:hypothetical protein